MLNAIEPGSVVATYELAAGGPACALNIPAGVYQRMDAVKMIDEYIIPNYEVLHSESRKNVTEGLIDTLKRWEERGTSEGGS